MRFLSFHEKQTQRDQKRIARGWRPYFLILPMQIGKYIYWLEYIERRVRPSYPRDILGQLNYQYRLKGDEQL